MVSFSSQYRYDIYEFFFCVCLFGIWLWRTSIRPSPQKLIEEKDPPEALLPLLVVDPIRIYEEQVCATTDVTVTLLNAGEGPLVV